MSVRLSGDTVRTLRLARPPSTAIAQALGSIRGPDKRYSDAGMPGSPITARIVTLEQI